MYTHKETQIKYNVWVNKLKGNTGKENVVENVEDDVDELPDSYFPKPPQEYLIK